MRNRSSSASGRGYVPSCSRGFWVANTIKGEGRSSVWSQMVTFFSSMASRSADCTFGGVRLISSARRIWVNIGHFRMVNSHFCCLYISLPVRSEGRRWGVNDTRLVSSPSTDAKVLIVLVLPSPGTHSRSACPPAKNVIISFLIIVSCPMISLVIWVLIADSVSWIWVRAEFKIIKN